MKTATIPINSAHVSVNRVQIIDLPGVPLDDEVRGRKGYTLLSNAAIVRYARRFAGQLALPAHFQQDSIATRHNLPRWLNDQLDADKTPVRAAAEQIARRLGRNLGYILLTLYRGDAVNRQARPDWQAEDWRRWAAVRQVWLGGGVVGGQLGLRMIDAANQLLGANGVPVRVTRSPWVKALTLLGAARYLPLADGQTLTLDFGQTSVKRGVVTLKAGALTDLRLLPALPVDWAVHNEKVTPATETAAAVFAFVRKVWVQTLTTTPLPPTLACRPIVMTVAAYVSGGQLLGNGLYATMSRLAPDFRVLLAQSITAETGQTVRVHLIHDGTAAAAMHAGDAAVVLTIGTALGVGFCPPGDDDLRGIEVTL